MLGFKFRFKVYAKNVREKGMKYSFKITDVLLDADRHVLI